MSSEFADVIIYTLGAATTAGFIYEGIMTHVANRPYAWKGYVDLKFPFYHKNTPVFIPPKQETKKEIRQEEPVDLGGLITIIDDINGIPSSGTSSSHQPPKLKAHNLSNPK